MTAQRGKPEQASEEHWRDAIAVFKCYRAFDGKDFRHDVNKLLAALKREAEEAYATAARIERRQSADLAPHDGAAIDGRLTRYAEQLDLAGLDLLRLVPIEPWLEQADPMA